MLSRLLNCFDIATSFPSLALRVKLIHQMPIFPVIFRRNIPFLDGPFIRSLAHVGRDVPVREHLYCPFVRKKYQRSVFQGCRFIDPPHGLRDEVTYIISVATDFYPERTNDG
ncbi:hypothetical protein TNCV_519091 [Trichonephila clavipes]|nr:hypothetical protein TNCV_519091 [Trichonephila clavipes]